MSEIQILYKLIRRHLDNLDALCACLIFIYIWINNKLSINNSILSTFKIDYKIIIKWIMK